MKREDDSGALQDFEFKYSLQVFKIYISYSVPDDEEQKSYLSEMKSFPYLLKPRSWKYKDFISVFL